MSVMLIKIGCYNCCSCLTSFGCILTVDLPSVHTILPNRVHNKVMDQNVVFHCKNLYVVLFVFFVRYVIYCMCMFCLAFLERPHLCYFRTSLPAPMFSRNTISIWGILKKCIGLVRTERCYATWVLLKCTTTKLEFRGNTKNVNCKNI